ncbi:MAG: esterase-like activity of phytase family protein [Verrucomicrobiota bacterium]|nr:esterase-like activity of phytase family protein [Verrucomicrobiota bacterium]
MRKLGTLLLVIGLTSFQTTCVSLKKGEPDRQLYSLTAGKMIPIHLPREKRFDASGLTIGPRGQLYFVNDKMATLYETSKIDETEMFVVPRMDLVNEDLLNKAAGAVTPRHDIEGIAFDGTDFYICDEAKRNVFRINPKSGKIVHLKIDWHPVQSYFSAVQKNASFEGIAVGNGKLYLANERDFGRIIVVDLKSMKVERSFMVRPSNTLSQNIHYSDLCWHKGSLFVLCRHNRVIIQVDPDTGIALSDYYYGRMEVEPQWRFHSRFPTGAMEGLYVTDTHFFLLIDNNGESRVSQPGDKRPLLFVCKRPDTKQVNR